MRNEFRGDYLKIGVLAMGLMFFSEFCADLWTAVFPLGYGTPVPVLAQGIDMLPPEDPEAGDSATPAGWPMAAANPQRTSWVAEEVRGQLSPIWYRVIESYIPPKVQIIAAEGLLFISTANGLYALDAETGETTWVYPTELPLGNSPTVFEGVLYVGGLDHNLHAIDVQTGAGIWTYAAGAGFETNPLVVDVNGHTVIYVGNHDGYMYAIEAYDTSPRQLWAYKTDGPIFFSAAYRDNTIYFASNDAYAYALNAWTGALVWKSDKLPGAGFHAWWPVLYQDLATGADVVILAGSNNYRHFLSPAYGYDMQNQERNDIFPNRVNEPRGRPFGTRYPDGSVNATRVLNYFEEKPWRRTYFMLDRMSGTEVTFDFDGDGAPEYAPVLWFGTHSGNRYPPMIGADGLVYQSNAYMSDEWIPGGQITGWSMDRAAISTPSAYWIAMDEPLAYSGGGDLVYWNHCNDRSAGAFDITIPNTRFWPDTSDPSREWLYYNAVGLLSLLPGYNILYEGVNPDNYGINSLFRGSNNSRNGVYGQHGHQNPPIPYAGKVYLHRSNAVIALGDYQGQPTHLPLLETVAAPDTEIVVTGPQLRLKLAEQVRKILNVGHLRPGYRSSGLFDHYTKDQCGDSLLDYWHQPSDILYALSLAVPYLPPDMQLEVKTYLQTEYATYSPAQYTHIGWQNGAAREPFDMPPEVEADRVNHPPGISGYGYDGWTWPPHLFYALWKYAEISDAAQAIFDANQAHLETPPANAYLIEYPYIHNAYIAGYLGYLELESLAGYAESVAVRAELNRLLALRVATFSKDTPYTDGRGPRSLSVSRNFIYLVPELAQYLRDNALAQVQAALAEYTEVAPYWFVADFDVMHGEGTSQHFYDSHALFQAKALILQESGDELAKYLDVPAVPVGDLFYIHKLITLLDTGIVSGLGKTGSVDTARIGETLTYTLDFSGYSGGFTLTDTLPVGISSPEIVSYEGTTVTPTYDSEAHQILWNDTLLMDYQVTMRYRVTVLTAQPTVLKNIAMLSGIDGISSTATFSVMVNVYHCYLPLIMRVR